MLRDMLRQLAHDYGDAKRGIFNKDNEYVSLIEKSAVSIVRGNLTDISSDVLVEGSAGEGQWADIPWITIMDPRVTDSPTRGHYVAYLFNWRKGTIALSLNQGSTQVKKEHGIRRNAVLTERAARIRSRLQALPLRFSSNPISLNSTTPLGKSYEPGHAIGVTYDIANLPDENRMSKELELLVQAYLKLFRHGGTNPALTEDDKDAISDERPQAKSLTEMRIYRAHRAVERRPNNSKKAKAFHGYACQACGMTFEASYGGMGKHYIEAHHLIPLSTLEVGIPAIFDISKDFCVLCANCHRMIHRQNDPSDLEQLKISIANNLA